jgi:hypothetical protein
MCIQCLLLLLWPLTSIYYNLNYNSINLYKKSFVITLNVLPILLQNFLFVKLLKQKYEKSTVSRLAPYFTNLLTYLCGTTSNIWLRPVEEDLSMRACLEHSASNL